MVTTNTSYGYSATGASNQVSAASNTVSENKDMFTKLLVAQIMNQDPLAPSDPSEFVNQLSQLSQTEAMEKMTQTTAASATMLQSLQVLAMGSQVGSDVSVQTDRVVLDGSTLNGNVQLGGSSTLTHVVLTDVVGRQTRVELPPHGAGAQAFSINPKSLGLPDGKYTISAEAADGTQPAIEINARVNSVRLSSNGAMVLNIAGVGDVDPSALMAFNGKTSTAQTAALASQY